MSDVITPATILQIPKDEHSVQTQSKAETESDDIFTLCAQCGYHVLAIKGDSHNYCQNCGFRDSCC